MDNLNTENNYQQPNSTADIKQVTSTLVEPIFGTKYVSDILYVFESVKNLVDECTLVVNSEGLKIRTMDSSHVALIDVDLPSSYFEYFEVAEEVKAGIRVDELVKLLKTFEKKEPIKFVIDGRMINLIQEKQKASMFLIETSGSTTPLPKLNFNAQFDLNKEGIKKFVQFLELKEYVTIKTENNTNTVTLTSKDDSGETEQKYNDLNYLADLQIKDGSLASYSNEYIKKFLKAVSPVVNTAKFEYSTKMPMRIQVRHSQIHIGKIDFYLAPRVQD